MMQTIAIIIILTITACYVGWKIRQLWFRNNDLCCGCDGCDVMKKQMCDKKSDEKFCQSK